MKFSQCSTDVKNTLQDTVYASPVQSVYSKSALNFMYTYHIIAHNMYTYCLPPHFMTKRCKRVNPCVHICRYHS